MTVYAIDIDGVLCVTDGNDYPHARPNYSVIAKVNALHDQGHTVRIYTARGSSSGINWRKFTEKQLSIWGVRYHELILGKPSYDVLVDDKAITPDALMADSLSYVGETR